MKTTDFKRLYDFIGDDKFIYILLLKKINIVAPTNNTMTIASYIKNFPHMFITANINISDKGERISFHNIPNKGFGNCLLVKQDVLFNVIEKLGISFAELKKNKSIFSKTINSIKKQEVLKRDRIKNNKVIVYGDGSKELTDWAKKNQESVNKSITSFEDKVYFALRKTLKNKIKRQQAFMINGKIYYPDLCIRSKKIIIEVDGGYHGLSSQKKRDKERDIAFKSIGYDVIRVTNEQVQNKAFLKELKDKLIEITKK